MFVGDDIPRADRRTYLGGGGGWVGERKSLPALSLRWRRNIVLKAFDEAGCVPGALPHFPTNY